MTSTISIPKFQNGGLAFYWMGDRLKAVSIDRIKHSCDGGFTYLVARNGLSYTMHESELLTGWEPHFPAWEQIDWADLLGQDEPLVEEKPAVHPGFQDEWNWWDDQDALEGLIAQHV